MKFRFVFGFMLLILVFIAIFVGLPYFLKIIKSNQFLNLPSLKLPRLIPVSTSTGYFFSKPASYPQRYQPVTAAKPGESIFKGRINIYSVYRYGRGEVDLSAAYFEGGSIDITGWKIKSEKRGETIIGKGLALPQFSSFLSDIRLKSGDSVKIIAGQSPLSSSFQVNGCFGWLNSVYSIDSSLNYCPMIAISDLTGLGLDSACQNLILNSGFCRAPADTVLNNYSRECRIWVEQNLNYNACVKQHMNESDFYKGWQVYTGGNLFFDQLHDRLELHDQTGLLVDSYEY